MTTRTVNVHEAKTHLSRLLDKVARGEELVIAKAGKPVARLVGIKSRKPKRKAGFLKGKLRVSQDFDAPLSAEELALFEGGR